MAVVFIPAMLRDYTGGESQVQVGGRSLGSIIGELEERFPGIKGRLLEGSDLRSDLAVAVDGELALEGLAEGVREQSEVHFIPPLSGG